MSNEDQGVTYGNVGVLDMRAADEAALRKVRRIGNLGMLVHSRDNAALVNVLSVGNIGCTIEAPAHYKLEVAPVRFNAQALRNRSESVGMIIMAPVAVESDVSAEDIEQYIERLFIMGPVICPDNVVAALRSKTEQQMGPVTSYPAGARLVSTLGALRLDHGALATLEDGTALNVEGRLTVPEPLPADLLARKIRWLNVDGAVLCHEENAPILHPLMPKGSEKLRLLPAGCQGRRAGADYRRHVPSVQRDREVVRYRENHRRFRRHRRGNRPESEGVAVRGNDPGPSKLARLSGSQV